jgi:hypothetical protein
MNLPIIRDSTGAPGVVLFFLILLAAWYGRASAHRKSLEIQVLREPERAISPKFSVQLSVN